jgi:heavy metal translocating P-type ATPase
LYKDAEAMQKAKDINCVLLDKTATLTVGQPTVTDFQCIHGSPELLLTISYAMELQSNHPIAECICSYAKNVLADRLEIVKLSAYDYITGKGAQATYAGKKYYLGNRHLLNVSLNKQAYDHEASYSEQGKTAVFLADENTLLAVFAIADTLKEQSKEAVTHLKQRGIRVGILTGDNENVAKAIAKEVGIDDYYAEALPKDKADAVERVRSVGGCVAMVGDGINDSPALKAADVGIAMGNGTDVAMDSADIVLSRGDLSLIGKTIDLSKATVKNIHQNLFWAFFYNCIAIPVAAGVFSFVGIVLTPMIGAACMSLSSLFVVTNALRLTRFDRQKNENKQGDSDMKTTMKIEGMMCQHCVAHVTKALLQIDGISNVEVNLKKKTATFDRTQEITDEKLTQAIVDAGYEVKKIS